MIPFNHKTLLFCAALSTCLVSLEAFALGGLGLGHSSKAKGTNGVLAINSYVCANMNCGKSNLKFSDNCQAKNSHLDYGNRVCICNENYKNIGTNELNCVLDESCANAPCPSGTYCHNGECYCSGTNKIACGKKEGAFVCCESNSICSIDSSEVAEGTCTPKPEEASCLNSDACQPDNQYCSFQQESTTSFENGHCENIDTEEDIKSTDHYIYSKDSMDWWSARNWCQKQGLEMVNASELSCSTDDMTDKGFSDSCSPSSDLGELSGTDVVPFHFWLLNTPSYTVCTDIAKDNPNVWDTCKEATGTPSKTTEYQKEYADFFTTTKLGDNEKYKLHWLHRKYNFLAHALCKKN